MEQDHAGLASAETHLIHVLRTSTPPRDADEYHVTEAAEDFHARHGSWDIQGAGDGVAEELLARHAK